MLISSLSEFCPELEIAAIAHNNQKAISLLQSQRPSLLFFDLDLGGADPIAVLDLAGAQNCLTILLGECDIAQQAYNHWSVSAIMRKPVKIAELILTVRNALEKMEMESRKSPSPIQLATKDTVGIPTIDGYEYLKIEHIIRCEGLQKCTRIVTADRKDIVSAYPIGTFRELLEPFGFYDVHRSHLINLSKVTSFSREGFVFLSDQSRVPLARRRRADFLAIWRHP